jgi:hypothetical protein
VSRHRAEMATVELGKPGEPKSGFWREFSGAVASGVVMLAAVVLVLQVISWFRGMPGLGTWVMIGHLVAAGLAVVTQRVVDRRDGRPARLAGLGLGLVVLALLLLFWWS